jgi:sugar/nucleoside kinase (ribokinase family)
MNLKNEEFGEHVSQTYDVIVMDNALVDFLIEGSSEDLNALGLAKGTMSLVDKKTQAQVLKKLKDVKVETELGGSGANIARGLAQLNARVVYSSTIGPDAYGQMFKDRLAELHIDNRVSVVEEDTGTCVVVVTPDGERTFHTCLGACQMFQKEHLPVEDIKRSKIFLSTGYVLDIATQAQALESAIQIAQKNGVKVVFDVADPYVISRHKQTLLDLLPRVHTVFANAQESKALVSCNGKQAAILLATTCHTAVVKEGSQGSYIASGQEVHFIPAGKTKVVDTTGAGDMYAAGFLWGVIKGLPLYVCGQVATLMAQDTIGYLGARLSPNILKRLEEHVVSVS